MRKENNVPLGKGEGPDQFISDGMNAFERNVKRVGDCFLAFIALIVFSPLFLICYVVVGHEDGGSAIFKQERFGRPFNIYKFRSMRLDAEKFGPALYKGGADPRMTRVGKFLREHHLDELPQLWNVFIGDIPVRSASSISTRSWSVSQLPLPLSDPSGRDLLRHVLGCSILRYW